MIVASSLYVSNSLCSQTLPSCGRLKICWRGFLHKEGLMGIQIDRWMDDKSSHTSFIKQTNTCQLISDGLLFTGFREKRAIYSGSQYIILWPHWSPWSWINTFLTDPINTAYNHKMSVHCTLCFISLFLGCLLFHPTPVQCFLCHWIKRPCTNIKSLMTALYAFIQ